MKSVRPGGVPLAVALELGAGGGEETLIGRLSGFFPELGDMLTPGDCVAFTIECNREGLPAKAGWELNSDEEISMRVMGPESEPIGTYDIANLSCGLSESPGGFMYHCKATSQEYVLASSDLWTMFSSGAVHSEGLWRRLSRAERPGWLEVARKRWSEGVTPVNHSECISVDCREIQDHLDFYCAIGEAVHGPGGYFGANINSLLDMFSERDAPRAVRFLLSPEEVGEAEERHLGEIIGFLDRRMIRHEIVVSM